MFHQTTKISVYSSYLTLPIFLYLNAEPSNYNFIMWTLLQCILSFSVTVCFLIKFLCAGMLKFFFIETTKFNNIKEIIRSAIGILIVLSFRILAMVLFENLHTTIIFLILILIWPLLFGGSLAGLLSVFMLNCVGLIKCKARNI